MLLLKVQPLGEWSNYGPVWAVTINAPEPPVNDEARIKLIFQMQAQACRCINAHPGFHTQKPRNHPETQKMHTQKFGS